MTTSSVDFVDPREPWATYGVSPQSLLEVTLASIFHPGRTEVHSDGDRSVRRYGLLLPDAAYWVDSVRSLLVALTVGVALSALLYGLVVRGRRQRQGGGLTRGSGARAPAPPPPTVVSILTGWGLAVPLCVLFPYHHVSHASISNAAVRFNVSLPFVLFLFRTLEAVHGQTPEWASRDWPSFALYFVPPVEWDLDAVTGRPTRMGPEYGASIKRGAASLMKHMCLMSALMSILSPHGYEPFSSNAGDFDEPIVMSEYFNPRHLANCAAVAMLFQLSLSTGMGAAGISAEAMTGLRTVPIMRNPLLGATSVIDFWSHRWNMLVHRVLKGGVYKPVRHLSNSALIATLASFVASGLFHEWLVHLALIYETHRGERGAAQTVRLGSNTAFFVWNAATMAAERILGGSKAMRTLSRSLPGWMVTFLIVMTSLPIAHWFGNPYIKSGFFFDYQIGFPLVVKL